MFSDAKRRHAGRVLSNGALPVAAVLGLLIGCCLGAASATEKPANLTGAGQATATLKRLGSARGVVSYYRPMRIVLGKAPREKLAQEPAYKSPNPQYGAITIGDGEDKTITIVVDEPKGGERLIYVDRNNDEDLTNDGSAQWQRRGSTSDFLSTVVQVNYRTPQGDAAMPYGLCFYRFRTRLRNVVLYYRNECCMGEVALAGKTYKIAIVDDNADGLFNDLAAGALVIDIDGDGKLYGRSGSHELYKLAEPFNVAGVTYEAAAVSPDGTQIRIARSDKTVPAKAILAVGYPALDFSAPDLKGDTVSLADLRGQVVLLDFWATWCRPCRAALPHVKEAYAEFKDKGFAIIGISLDSDRAKLTSFVEKQGLAWPQVFDGKGWKNRIAQLYRVHSIPSTFLVDGKGVIRYRNLRGQALGPAVAALLGVKAKPQAPARPAALPDNGHIPASLKGACIDPSALQRTLTEKLSALYAQKKTTPMETLVGQLSRKHCRVSLPLASAAKMSPVDIYRERRKGVLILAGLYKCPKCSKLHVSIASGFLLTKSGVAATGYHVANRPDRLALAAMTYDGAVHPVREVLAGRQSDDAVLMQIEGSGFAPLRLSLGRPVGSPVWVIGHPSKQFYSLTQGIISGYFVDRVKGSRSARLTITADIGVGSSGAPVFDEGGGVVGMAAATQTLYATDNDGHKREQMVFRKCVPAEAILELCAADSKP